MRLPSYYRDELNELLDQALAAAWLENPNVDNRPRAVQIALSQLGEPYWEALRAHLHANLYTEFIREKVKQRVNQRALHTTPSADAGEDIGDLPEVLYEEGKHPYWIKPPGEGGRPTPKPLERASVDDHRQIADRRETQARQLLRKMQWHRATATEGERRGLTDNVAKHLFDIENGNGLLEIEDGDNEA